MTTVVLSMAFAIVTAANPTEECSLVHLRTQRSFTNADLARIAACRSSGAHAASEGEARSETRAAARRPSRPSDSTPSAPDEARERDWRAQWRSVDQRVRRLRRDAAELRAEADDAPRDPKKRPTGRRSPAVLIARAAALESEARDLESDFQERARREGALPGWLRSR